MKTFNKFGFWLPPVLLLAACSAEQTYEGMQMQARSDCLNTAPQNEYAECVERTNTSYQEYEQRRQENNDGNR